MSPRTLAEIQHRWLRGETIPQLARDYGVTRRRIRRIVAAALDREHDGD
jgi:hypothetical protein